MKDSPNTFKNIRPATRGKQIPNRQPRDPSMPEKPPITGTSIIQGSLLSGDFLRDSILSLPDWDEIDANALANLQRDLRGIFDRFPTNQTPNESQTEDDLIWPVLARLGWTAHLRQQNLAPKGRDDVPDGILFQDAATKAKAVTFREEWRRYEFGLAVVESKRWARPLDRRSGRRGEETAPFAQMLRYLRRIDDLTTGKLRWGILTNGAKWRLYYQGARSVSEQFFEIDLAAVLGVPGHDEGLFALTSSERAHWLKVFTLIFRREAFLPGSVDRRSFHQRALDEGRFYEERVSANLSNLVFGQVFPELARAIAASAPTASLQEVRDAALIVLYRLLFILYAEDRDLLPVRDDRYNEYGLRERVRSDVGTRKDRNDAFSDTATRYWSAFDDLCRAIDTGDSAIGLPPYNGGLFDGARTPLLKTVRLNDRVIANVIDALSFEQTPNGRKYINYRDLSVQQLGSIYERLLEYEIVREKSEIDIRPNVFARKGSGSYYTPDDLVGLIIREAVEPLVAQRIATFNDKAGELAKSKQPENYRIGALKRLDPAEKLLDLKVCDPAMGSGHFLVSLVDYLADRVITAMADAEATVAWGEYVSPLSDRIDTIRNTILANAEQRGWTIDPAQLDDRHIVRRMVLKRCIYGVDKNLMAVELSKVSLWLHTFTVGAPLSFLDHHLRCGDSLFGSWVRRGIERATKQGAPLFLHGPLTRATRAAAAMQIIEGLTDAEIAEAHRSKEVFDEVMEMTAPLDAILSLIHAFEWLDLSSQENVIAVQAFLIGQFGDPVDIALGKISPLDQQYDKEETKTRAVQFFEVLKRASTLIREERFLNWEVAFPGVWSNWDSANHVGGFDAVIGNPPWDVYEFEEVSWFAARNRQIALLQSDKERAAKIGELKTASDPLWKEYGVATERVSLGSKILRSKNSDYKLLNKGKLNLFKLFVERACNLTDAAGFVGLLTPTGIATDETSANFFSDIASTGRLRVLFDFENRRTRHKEDPFFPDVDSRFKFCVFVASQSPSMLPASCAFFLQDVGELADPERRFELSADDFKRVNPNTRTAPLFRFRKDAVLTTHIYDLLPVVSNRSGPSIVKQWPVQFDQMLNMTTDANLFVSRETLETKLGGYPVENNRWDTPSGQWLPLYEGKMVQAFDHRAADIVIRPGNVFRPGQQEALTAEEKADPNRFPTSRHFVQLSKTWWKNHSYEWTIGFKDVTSSTNIRTMIAAIIPLCGAGHTLPVLNLDKASESAAHTAAMIVGNLNSVIFDFVSRQKVQTNHFSNYILEQIPVVPLTTLKQTKFGKKSAEKIVTETVLELTYTANDLQKFANDMGYVDKAGKVRPPFKWDEARRQLLIAKLDALFFHLYGVTSRKDVQYIFSTFPIWEREQKSAFKRYRSQDLCLAWMNALAAGNPDAEIAL